MRKRIGIVGAGTAGLHLGIHLRRHDIDVTIFTDRPPRAQGGGRLLNTVAHHALTIEREERLGVNHWPSEQFGYGGHHYHVGGPEPLDFYGALQRPSRAIDYRLYQPRLMEDFLNAGGATCYQDSGTDDIGAIAALFDLVVVCTGAGPLARLFPQRPEHSPFAKPQRMVCAGLFTGVRPMPARALTMSFSPGCGEMFEIPTWSSGGMVTALLMENHAGGDMACLSHIRYEEGRRAFLSLLLEKLRKHHPTVAQRIDEHQFDLANGPLDLLQGGVTPVVREGHVPLDGGKMAIALGDAHMLADPLMGQGANMASYAAEILAEEIVREEIYDQRFCERVELRRLDRVLSASRWTNQMLAGLTDPPVALREFIGTLATNRSLADRFTDNFNYPERQWDCFSSPRRMRTWCESALR